MADRMGRVIAVRGLEVALPPDWPVAQWLIGQPVHYALDVLPRVFNLCKTAQALAVRLAAGQNPDDADLAALHREIVRDHRIRLGVVLPAWLGLTPAKAPPIPPGMDLDEALAMVPLLAALQARFAPFDAAVAPDPAENSVAARQAHLPILQEAEERFGRGPLWRVLARFCELAPGTLPAPGRDGGGVAVPTARGTYRMRMEVTDGRIAAFARTTPTDDMLRRGGLLERALEALKVPEDAALLVAVLDPCVPLEIRQAHHA